MTEAKDGFECRTAHLHQDIADGEFSRERCEQMGGRHLPADPPRETIVFYRDTPYELRVTGVRDVPPADPPRTEGDWLIAGMAGSLLLHLAAAKPWIESLTETQQRRKLEEWLVEIGVTDLYEQLEASEAELLRLCGPPCDHCGGKRAIEHGIRLQRDIETPYLVTCVHIDETHTVNTDDGEVCPACHTNGIADPHPPAPAIVQWLERHRGDRHD